MRPFVVSVLGILFILTSNVVKCQLDDAEFESDAFEDAVNDDEKPISTSFSPVDYKTPNPPQPYHFADAFTSKDEIGKKWIRSEAMKDSGEDALKKYDGEWRVDVPEKTALKNDLALILTTRARHHAISSRLDKPYKFSGKPFVMQYEVKFEHGQECGGAYVKLLTDSKHDLKQFTDKTPYTIMFGPDKCGLTSKVHFIMRYENPKNKSTYEHHAKQPENAKIESYFTDELTHLYTLIIQPDGAFKVLVDHNQLIAGNLNSDLEPSIRPPTEIEDPNEKKPEDWDDREKIVDPDAKKPDDWDESQPEMIEDESATMPSDWLVDEEDLIVDEFSTKPSDWDEEMDGKWEPAKIKNPKCESAAGCGPWRRPQIKNPLFKGKWHAPKIDNPAYKGKWRPQIIPNPHYFEANAYEMSPIGVIGLELWTMSDNIVFDNFILTDSEQVAVDFARDTYDIKHIHEEQMKASAKSSVPGIFAGFLSATEERPWLWALLLLVILVPTVLIVVFCCGSGSKKEDDIGHVKKHDIAQADDDENEPPEGGATEDDEEEEDDEPENEPGPSNAKPSAKQEKKSKADLEDDDHEDGKQATRSPARGPRSRARKE